MFIRTATLKDLSEITKIGEACYSFEEAVTKSIYEERLKVYPEHFWILEHSGEIVAFINGPVTDSERIEDAMFHDASLHKEHGTWQAILGVNTAPLHQKKGYASKMMEQLLSDAKKQGRKGCILTCKKELIGYYQKWGFENLGISKSIYAGQKWYDMALFLNKE